MRLPWRLALILAVVIGVAIPLALAVAQGPVAVGDNCFAVATRWDHSVHNGSGKSLLQAEADALSKCRAYAYDPSTCRIVRSHCDAAQKSGAVNDHRWVDDLRQKKISVNWESGLVAAIIHLAWIWHIFNQKTLAQPAKAGLGFGVPIIQAGLAYVLGSDGEIGLLELPIFALPLGLGELVASVSIKRRSE
jgi:hypothetical protein